MGVNKNYGRMEMRHHRHRKVIELRDKSILGELIAADFCRLMSIIITGNISFDLLSETQIFQQRISLFFCSRTARTRLQGFARRARQLCFIRIDELTESCVRQEEMSFFLNYFLMKNSLGKQTHFELLVIHLLFKTNERKRCRYGVEI